MTMLTRRPGGRPKLTAERRVALAVQGSALDGHKHTENAVDRIETGRSIDVRRDQFVALAVRLARMGLEAEDIGDARDKLRLISRALRHAQVTDQLIDEHILVHAATSVAAANGHFVDVISFCEGVLEGDEPDAVCECGEAA